MRRAAIRMTLSDKVREGTLIVLQDLTLDSPKTKDFVAMMQALDVERSVPSRSETSPTMAHSEEAEMCRAWTCCPPTC